MVSDPRQRDLLMLYEFVCEDCGLGYESFEFRGIGRYLRDCECGGRVLRCVSRMQVAPVIAPYFNHSVGAYVKSTRDFEEKLRIGAEVQSERLGLEHRYTPMYPSEARAHAESTASRDGRGGASLEGER